MPVLVFPSTSGACRLPLTQSVTIGRSPECDLVLEDTSVSRRHASVAPGPGGWELRDLGSTKGTFLNGQRVETAPLRANDQLRLGNVVLRFEEEASPPATRSSTTDSMVAATDDGRVSALSAELRQARALLSLHETFLRCSSLGMLLQGVGRDLVLALRCERCGIFSRQGPAPAWRVDFLHGTAEVPAEWLRALEQGRVAGAFVEATSPVDRRTRVAASLSGGEVDAVLVAELPGGRVLDEAARELTRALCSQVSSAVQRLALQAKTRRDEVLRTNLSRYLSEQVAQAVVEGRLDLKLGGQRRDVSILFVDVRGFTRLSEQLEPEAILQILNAHFGRIVPIIKAAQGTVDKFIGDALMAVFGAPNELPDHPLRAVRAAVAIQRAAADLARELSQTVLKSQGLGQRFAVGVGVNTGPAVAGNLGTDDRREYAVIGDTVNVASRLCAAAGPTEVLVGPITASALRGQVELADGVPVKVKGREQPVLTYRVLGVASGAPVVGGAQAAR